MALHHRDVEALWVLEVGGETIETTDEHPFYVANQGWTEAKDLRTGDILIASTGNRLTLEKIERVEQPARVYNFEVRDLHSYLVGEMGVVVHNCKRGPKTDPNAPHNAKIREVAASVNDGQVIHGGGVGKEKLIPTPGGHKSGRRPDILVRRPDGSVYGINVGKTEASGLPVKREREANEDLEGADIPMHFVPYDR